MAILKQNENVQTVYLGWYGQCGEPKCVEFDLLSKSDMIAKVFQFSEDGVATRTFVSDVPEYMNSFTKLICGNPYYIILKKGLVKSIYPTLLMDFIQMKLEILE